MSLDSTTIDLCVSLFDWAKFRRTKGAIKLHLLLDHDGYLPSYAVVTDGKAADVKVARRLSFEPGRPRRVGATGDTPTTRSSPSGAGPGSISSPG